MEDNVMPKGKWDFDSEVTASFDNMLERSIPDYAKMRSLVTRIASEFIKHEPGTCIVDLGTSRGEALQPLVDAYRDTNIFVGLEVSDPMIAAATERFQNEITGLVDIRKHDLRTGLPQHMPPCSVVLSILTLQFTPIEYRPHIVTSVYETLKHGGVFILVEKVIGQTSHTDRLMNKLYYEMKGDNGYSQEQIERKRLSLEGVLVPVTAKWNEEILTASGFNPVECFWRWMNFAGWIGVKR